MSKQILAILIIAFTPLVALAGGELDDDFSGKLDEGHWCSCQIDTNRLPVTFSPDQDDPSDSVAHITVDEKSLGGRKCAPSCARKSLWSWFTTTPPEEPSPLGPSLLTESGPVWQPSGDKPNPYCTEEVRAAANAVGEGLCIQRQELRLQEQFVGNADTPYAFSFRFKMPATVLNSKDSIRWVTAQWKAEPAFTEDGVSASPFLAQRYDDGILNITVQNKSCRCLIASAPLADGTSYIWKSGNAGYCQSSDTAEVRQCDGGLSVEYGPSPLLTSPAGRWVEMKYVVEASVQRDANVEVFQDGRFIARVTGRIGYDLKDGETQKTKFKIGQYRDYIPSTDTMDIDWVKIVAVP